MKMTRASIGSHVKNAIHGSTTSAWESQRIPNFSKACATSVNNASQKTTRNCWQLWRREKSPGKKGKGKRASDPKLEPEQNGKGKAPETPAEVKKEKKETASRTGSVKRKLQKEDSLEEPAKVRVTGPGFAAAYLLTWRLAEQNTQDLRTSSKVPNTTDAI